MPHGGENDDEIGGKPGVLMDAESMQMLVFLVQTKLSPALQKYSKSIEVCVNIDCISLLDNNITFDCYKL